MNIDTIKTLFGAAANIQNIKAGIMSFVMDTSNPMEERRWVWENCPEELMAVEAYYMDYSFTDGTEVSWYDDFYIERGQLVICKNLQGRGRFSDSKEWDVFVEECLRTGTFSFKFDW